MMDSDIQHVADAWVEAGKKLGIRVDAPFELLDAAGRVHCFAAYIPDYGGENGAVVLVAKPPEFERDAEAEQCAKEGGYWCSVVNAESYSTFDHDLFTSTLNDWQYFGELDSKPAWYTGTPWGHEDSEQDAPADADKPRR